MEVAEQVKECRNDYYRKWRAANKDKVRQYNQKYWKRRTERLKAEAAREATGKVGSENKMDG